MLTLTNLAGNTALPVGTSYTIVDNTGISPISGTFAGLPQGSVINSGNNAFMITYVGGTGNDIALTAIGTLPVGLTNYSTQLMQNSSVQITWSTSVEVNNSMFILERSADNQTYTELTRMTSAGTSGSYSFTDPSPLEGTNYYRLKQVDKDGTVKELGIRLVKLQGKKIRWSVYPNPVTGKMIFIKAGNINENTVSIKLIDALGRIILTKNFGGVTSAATLQLQLNEKLAPDNYTLEVNDEVIQLMIK